MVIIQGQGTISVTEPGRSQGSYYENAQITVYGPVVHYVAHGMHHTASATMCLIGWKAEPVIRVTDSK